MLKEPLGNSEAKAQIREILRSGEVVTSAHAMKEMEADGLSEVDVINVLRAGTVEYSEFVSGSWRYRVKTFRMYAVVAFRGPEALVVVTAWRMKR